MIVKVAGLHDSAEFHLQGAAIAHLKAEQVRTANGWFFSGLLPEPASQTLQANPPSVLNCDPNPEAGCSSTYTFFSLARHFEGIKIMLVQDGCFASIGECLQNIQYIQYHNTMVDHLIHPCLNCPSGHRGRPNWVVR